MVPGVTDSQHALRIARFYLLQKLHRNETHTFEASIDHLVCQRGSLIHLQQDTIGVGQVSGRVVAVDTQASIKSLRIDCIVEFEAADKEYAIRVRSRTGSQQLINIYNIPGSTYPYNTTLLQPDPADAGEDEKLLGCLLYTSPSPRD